MSIATRFAQSSSWPAFREPVEDLLQGLEPVRVVLFQQEADGHRFQRLPDLDHLGGLGARQAGDAGSAAGQQLDEAFVVELAERVADGAAAEAELLGEFAFGEVVAGLVATGEDVVAEPVGDLAAEAGEAGSAAGRCSRRLLRVAGGARPDSRRGRGSRRSRPTLVRTPGAPGRARRRRRGSPGGSAPRSPDRGRSRQKSADPANGRTARGAAGVSAGCTLIFQPSKSTEGYRASPACHSARRCGAPPSTSGVEAHGAFDVLRDQHEVVELQSAHRVPSLTRCRERGYQHWSMVNH